MQTDTNMNPLQDAASPPTQPSPEEPESGELLELFLALLERKAFVLTMTLAGGIVSATIAFLLPPLYTATTSIMPPQQQQSAASALLGQLGPIAAVAGSNLGLKTPSDLYIGILASRTIADDLITRFDLQRIYKKRTLTDARRLLATRSSFNSGRDSLIRISVQDHDPKRAAALANAYVEGLYRQNGRLALTESAARRLFFERQMQAQKKSLADSEVALKATQERTGVLQVNSQVESAIQAMARLRAEITSREVALASLTKAATSQNPEVVRQEAELKALRERLRGLEATGDPVRSGDPMIPTSQVPKAGLEYVRAIRDLKYNETLFELLSKQYEAARIDEAKDAPLIQVVDSAVPPERKSWPPRAAYAFAGAFGCCALACIIVLIGNRFRNTHAQKIALLRRRPA